MFRPPVVLLVFVLASLAALTGARTHVFSRPHDFTRDVRAALSSLLSRAPASPSPARKRALASAPGKCLAVAPGQFPLSPTNGTSTTPSPPGAGPGSGSSGTQAPAPGGAAPSSSSSSRPGSTAPPAPPAPSAPSAPPPANPAGSSPWKVAQYYAGNDFFDGWDFYTDPDPTHGTVQYVSEDSARANGLVSINDAGNAIMRVETTPQVANNRMSVRITTKYSYTGALIILDAVHMPVGCATWPAFWSNGPHWPDNGEIDILEGVNEQVNNQATIHTRTGCTVPTSVGATGTQVNGNNCDVAATGNAGCGTVLSNADGPNYGSAFNAAGGGVYAMLWDDQAISVWWFARGAGIPSDITSRAPNPQSWGTPWARWPGTTCDTMSFFRNHNAIFDTTLCGDWASGVWGQSCAAETGIALCADFVRQRGDAFANAYWEVKSVAIYQQS